MNEIEKEFYEAGRSEALPAKTDEFIWVLDAANGNVLKVEIPIHFPENGDYEDYLEANLPEGIRLQDCNWLIAGAGVQTVVRWRYHKGNQGENNMACQQAKFTDATELARFVAELVQLGVDFDIVQTTTGWIVDLSQACPEPDNGARRPASGVPKVFRFLLKFELANDDIYSIIEI